MSIGRQNAPPAIERSRDRHCNGCTQGLAAQVVNLPRSHRRHIDLIEFGRGRSSLRRARQPNAVSVSVGTQTRWAAHPPHAQLFRLDSRPLLLSARSHGRHAQQVDSKETDKLSALRVPDDCGQVLSAHSCHHQPGSSIVREVQNARVAENDIKPGTPESASHRTLRGGVCRRDRRQLRADTGQHSLSDLRR